MVGSSPPPEMALVRVQKGDQQLTPVTVVNDAGEFVFSSDGAEIAVVAFTDGGQDGFAIGPTNTSTMLPLVTPPPLFSASLPRFVVGSHDFVYAGPRAGLDMGGGMQPVVRYTSADGTFSQIAAVTGNDYYYVAFSEPNVTLLIREHSTDSTQDLFTLLPNATTPVLFDTNGREFPVHPSGRFIFTKTPTAVSSSFYLEVGDPDGTKLATLPAGGVQYGFAFVDDNHVLYVDGNHTLSELDVPSQQSTPLESNVYGIDFKSTTRKLTTIVRGTAADGIYVGTLP